MKITRYSLSLIALSIAISLFPMQVKAQYAGYTTTTSPLTPIVTQLLTPSTTTPNFQQMQQQFLLNHPNFQQQYPAAYNQLVNNPQSFFANQGGQHYVHRRYRRYENYQNY